MSEHLNFDPTTYPDLSRPLSLADTALVIDLSYEPSTYRDQVHELLAASVVASGFHTLMFVKNACRPARLFCARRTLGEAWRDAIASGPQFYGMTEEEAREAVTSDAQDWCWWLCAELGMLDRVSDFIEMLRTERPAQHMHRLAMTADKLLELSFVLRRDSNNNGDNELRTNMLSPVSSLWSRFKEDCHEAIELFERADPSHPVEYEDELEDSE